MRTRLLVLLAAALLIPLSLAAQWTSESDGRAYVDFWQRTSPENPPTGARRLFVDSVTGELSVRNSTGTTVSLEAQGGGGASLPSGAIIISLTSPCPNGFTQETSLNGKFVLGTVAASGDAGTTGGSDTITTVLNHTHPVTDPGHTHTLPVGATDDTAAPFDRADAGTNASGANATTASGSATTGVTTSNPAGGVASIDNRPAFVRVIFCRAN